MRKKGAFYNVAKEKEGRKNKKEKRRAKRENNKNKFKLRHLNEQTIRLTSKAKP